MIDKAEIECRFRRSIESYDENAYVQKVIVERLYSLLAEHQDYIPEKVLEIGCGTGLLTRKLRQQASADRLFVNDLVEEMCRKTADACCIDPKHLIIGDIERIHLNVKFNMIVSASTFQWFAHPADTFKKLALCLTRGELLVFSTFGCQNLQELKAVTGSGLPYMDAEGISRLLEPYFEVVIREEELYTLYFDEPVEVLRHLKKTGANAGNAAQVWTKGRITHFTESYNRLFLSDGKCPLTYHPLYFVCRRR